MSKALWWSGIAALGLVPPLAAQGKVPERTLARADAEYAESFDEVGALRELPGGRLLVVDRGPKAVLLADFRGGTQTTVGRNGQGPGEYQFPGELLPWRGDSTLLLDRVGRRLLAIGADGKMGRTIPLPEAMSGFPEVRGTDRQGRIYLQGSAFGPGAATSNLPDSVPLLRWDPVSNRIDTLGKVKVPSVKAQVTSTGNSRAVMMRQQPYAAADDWTVSADGRVAVARSGDYHVEWLGDRPARGAPVRYDRVRLSEADKETFLSASRNSRNRILINNGRPGRGGQEVRPPELSAADLEWPEYKPAFQRGVRITPEGELWVQRYTAAADSVPAFDVFNAQGVLTGRVLLPKGRRVVGMGQGVVYAVRIDDDGLQWLERYKR